MILEKHIELRKVMFEKGVKQIDLAEKLGISQGTLSRKMNNEVEWKWREVLDASRILGIEDPERYFGV